MFDALTGRRLFWWRRAFLGRFCRVVLPGAALGMPDPDELRIPEAIERYVGGLQVTLRLGLVGLFDLLNVLSIVLGYFRPVMWMPDAAVGRYLRRLETSRSYFLRNAFTAAKALAMLVYYGDARVEALTGYSDACLAPPRRSPT